jgi:hypothetical protein
MRVRHYKSYYRKKNNTPKVIITAVLAVLIVTVGFFAVKSLFKKTPTPQGDISSTSSIQSTSSEEPVRTSVIRAAFLTHDIASDLDKLASFIEDAKQKGITDVVLTVKDSTGYIYFDTAYKPAKNINNRSETVYDISLVVTALHNNGLKAVAHMHCFSDRIGTRIKNAGVLYSENHSVVWLDDEKENGGKSWLNPYSDEAAAYLNYLIDETVDMGFDAVMLDSVRFPGGYQNYAYYGENLSQRKDCLSGFVNEIKTRLKQTETDLWLYAPAESYVDPVTDIYTADYLSLGADTVLVDVMPKNFARSLAFSQVQIDKPIQNPKRTVSALLQLAAEKSKNSVRLVPVLQGYTDKTIVSEYNMVYTTEHFQMQLNALDQMAVSDFAIYSPNGSLDLLE